MDIQLSSAGNNVNYSSSLNNTVNGIENVPPNSSDKLSDSSDTVEISSQITAFSNALSSVAQDLETAKNFGYPFPPPYITNEKQVDIIKKMINEKLSEPVDDSTLSKAAEKLWRNAGYRLDTTPTPANTSGSGNIYNFLTKSDRENMDKIYDQATADGLDATRITRESASTLSMQRMKEVDIANGVVYGNESDIIPLSSEDLAKLAEEEKQKKIQSQKNAFQDDVLKKIPAMENFNLKEILLHYLQKHTSKP